MQVFLAWIIAPILSGCFGAIIFTITKYAVLVRSNPVMKGLVTVPIYFWLTACLLVMLLLWKGGGYEVNLTDEQIPGVIVGAGAGFALLVSIFLVPWLYRVVVKEDWQLKWYHIFMGPLLLKRGEVPPPPPGFTGVVRNFYEGHLTREELDARSAGHVIRENDPEHNATDEKKIASENNVSASDSSDNNVSIDDNVTPHKSMIGPKPEGGFSRALVWWYFKWAFLRGVDRDVVSSQDEKSLIAGNVREIHARARHYDNKTEFLYTFLQVMTAATASFTHGANDVANAIGPYATIFQIWQTGVVPDTNSIVPDWILAFGGGAIVIGLWTYGYNIMRNLGNRVTLQSPARGFAMELGSVITIVMATRLSK